MHPVFVVAGSDTAGGMASGGLLRRRCRRDGADKI